MNVTIKKELKVMVPILGIHHDEQYYPDHDRFDP
jgi:cytochrome P450